MKQRVVGIIILRQLQVRELKHYDYGETISFSDLSTCISRTMCACTSSLLYYVRIEQYFIPNTLTQ